MRFQLWLRTISLLSHQYFTDNINLSYTDFKSNYSLIADWIDAIWGYFRGNLQPSLHKVCKQKVFNHLYDDYPLDRIGFDASRELHHTICWQIYRGICFGSIFIDWAYLFEINYTKRIKRHSYEFFWNG